MAARSIVYVEDNPSNIALMRELMEDPDALYHYLYGDSTLNFPKYRSATVDAGLDGGRPIKDKDARKAVEKAVWGMLPKNKLGRQVLKKLKVYSGPNHPHQAQQATPFEISQVSQ